MIEAEQLAEALWEAECRVVEKHLNTRRPKWRHLAPAFKQPVRERARELIDRHA